MLFRTRLKINKKSRLWLLGDCWVEAAPKLEHSYIQWSRQGTVVIWRQSHSRSWIRSEHGWDLQVLAVNRDFWSPGNSIPVEDQLKGWLDHRAHVNGHVGPFYGTSFIGAVRFPAVSTALDTFDDLPGAAANARPEVSVLRKCAGKKMRRSLIRYEIKLRGGINSGRCGAGVKKGVNRPSRAALKLPALASKSKLTSMGNCNGWCKSDGGGWHYESWVLRMWSQAWKKEAQSVIWRGSQKSLGNFWMSGKSQIRNSTRHLTVWEKYWWDVQHPT